MVSYQFMVCLKRNLHGKQIRRYTKWTPPQGLSFPPAKARKAAEQAADAWMIDVVTLCSFIEQLLFLGNTHILPCG